MKLQGKLIAKDDAGQVTIIPEEIEDMWIAFNLICATTSGAP